MIRSTTVRHHLMLTLIALALAVRVLVPVGWMPSTTMGHATITLCTGSGMVEAWVDASGKIHKSSSNKGSKAELPCAFAGLGLGIDLSDLIHLAVPAPLAFAPVLFTALSVAIGHGLAAPPPPATGPPAHI